MQRRNFDTSPALAPRALAPHSRALLGSHGTRRRAARGRARGTRRTTLARRRERLRAPSRAAPAASDDCGGHSGVPCARAARGPQRRASAEAARTSRTCWRCPSSAPRGLSSRTAAAASLDSLSRDAGGGRAAALRRRRPTAAPVAAAASLWQPRGGDGTAPALAAALPQTKEGRRREGTPFTGRSTVGVVFTTRLAAMGRLAAALARPRATRAVAAHGGWWCAPTPRHADAGSGSRPKPPSTSRRAPSIHAARGAATAAMLAGEVSPRGEARGGCGGARRKRLSMSTRSTQPAGAHALSLVTAPLRQVVVRSPSTPRQSCESHNCRGRRQRYCQSRQALRPRER